MRKKKNKEHATQKASPVVRKPHEPTAFERAFLEAEAKKRAEFSKKTDAYEKKVAPASTVSQRVLAPTQQTFSHNITFVASSPKKKRVCIPPPTEPKKQPISVARKQPERKQQNLHKPAQIEACEKTPINMGLKPVPDEMDVLNMGSTITSQGGQQKHCAIRSPRAEKVCGRAQVHDGTYKDESDIVIGFDFGTSSSKVVVRDSGRKTAYAVPFGNLASLGNNYLVPTIIFICDDGSLSLSAGEYPYDSLKINLMDNPDRIVFETKTSQTITASELAAAYMALVICFARCWFLKHTEAIYKKTDIKWQMNLGIPSKNYDDQEIRKTFQDIAMAAWRISRLDTKITIADVKKYRVEVKRHILTESKELYLDEYESLWLHPDFINTHPEVIMEIVGYVRSPLRTSGLHLVVDVGATTLDLATFIIHEKDDENVFTLLQTNVERLGTMILHERRIQSLKDSLQKTLRQRISIDQTQPLPDLTHYEIQAGASDLCKNDEGFFDECDKKIAEVIRDTKKHRDPDSPAWKKGLPVFICGGGGRLSKYHEVIKDIGSRTSNSWDTKEFNIKPIPKPDQLEAPDLSHQEYDRLAVAYGLSFTELEIGKIIPESKISDIHKDDKTRSIEDRYVSKEMC